MMIAKFDAYRVGDRLLDGVEFDVHLEEHANGDVTLHEVTKPQDKNTRHYLKGINTKRFLVKAARQVEDDLKHLRKYAKAEGKTLVQLFDEWEAQGHDRASLVTEV